jgi:hypothetical protein
MSMLIASSFQCPSCEHDLAVVFSTPEPDSVIEAIVGINTFGTPISPTTTACPHCGGSIGDHSGDLAQWVAAADEQRGRRRVMAKPRPSSDEVLGAFMARPGLEAAVALALIASPGLEAADALAESLSELLSWNPASDVEAEAAVNEVCDKVRRRYKERREGR